VTRGRTSASADRTQQQPEPASLDPAELQHFVDQREEVSATLQDVLDAFPLRLGELADLHELGEPEDGVERRAKLVAHT
jgi:hypothetical protein